MEAIPTLLQTKEQKFKLSLNMVSQIFYFSNDFYVPALLLHSALLTRTLPPRLHHSPISTHLQIRSTQNQSHMRYCENLPSAIKLSLYKIFKHALAHGYMHIKIIKITWFSF